MEYVIRPAMPVDAEQICAVVRRSIVELCVEDHGNDPAILSRWLANKTVENVTRWIANPENINAVAESGGRLLAAACIRRDGELILNYVSPDARFKGVSSKMLAFMEAQARALGLDVVRLESTRTARRFYSSRGYRDAAEPVEKFGLTAYPMARKIADGA